MEALAAQRQEALNKCPPDQKIKELIGDYLQGSSSQGDGRIASFFDPSGAFSFDKVLSPQEIEANHQELLKNKYESLTMRVLCYGARNFQGKIWTADVALAVSAFTRENEAKQTISYRRYEIVDTTTGPKIKGERVVAYFFLHEKGYSLSSPGRAVVNSPDGFLALRSEPSRTNPSSLIMNLHNGDTVEYWPVAFKVHDAEKKADIEWCFVRTQDDVGGMVSMLNLRPISPAPSVLRALPPE
ncbi:hypothetical protein [Luteolibacter soli]|uniref:Uncharacterized protein n=1 Tax=Luteolibacter soli TaxID=3135280 RepID=A0ABU9B5R4_9BACT